MIMRARLTRPEPGLFSAEYPGEFHRDGDANASPMDSHIGTDRDGVVQFVETLATGLGYEQVEWEVIDPA